MRYLQMIQQLNPEETIDINQAHLNQQDQLQNHSQKIQFTQHDNKQQKQSESKHQGLAQHIQLENCDSKNNVQNHITSCCCKLCHNQLGFKQNVNITQIQNSHILNDNNKKTAHIHQIDIQKHQQREIKQKQHEDQESELDRRFDLRESVKSKIKIKAPPVEQEENQFDWGQDRNKQDSTQKRTYSHLFINTKYLQGEQKRLRLQQLEEKKHRKNKYVADNDHDLWLPVKESMLEKSRVTQLTNSVSNSKKLSIKRNNSNFIIEEQIQKNKKSQKKQLKDNKPLIKIGRQQSVKNKELLENIQSMKQAIKQKVQNWKKQNKQIQIRRQQQIYKRLQKEKQKQENQMIQAELKRNRQIKMRLQALQERLKIKNKVETQRRKIKQNNTGTQKSTPVTKSKSVAIMQKSISKQNQVFSLHWNKKDQLLNKQKQKYQRRKQFNSIVRKLPISINNNKKNEMLIQIDKSTNPLKYLLLQKRGISDTDIFNNYKDFQLPVDYNKKVGMKYLEQLRQKKLASESLKKYKSQQSVLNIPSYERNWKSPILQKIDGHKQSKKIISKKNQGMSLDKKLKLIIGQSNQSKIVKKR